MHRSNTFAQEATRKAEASERLLNELNSELEQRVQERTAELENAHSALLAVMNGSPDPMAALDPERRLTAFNRAYAEEFEARFKVKPRIGERLDDLLTPYPIDHARMLALWERAVEGLMVSEETFGDPQRGERTYQIHSSFVRDSTGRPEELVYSVRDVTEHRRLQRQLEQMNEKLERQVTELESFAYSVAHDLRAPLRAINSLTALLDNEYGVTAPAEARNYMQRVRRAAARMDALIRDLLVLSQVGRAEVVSRPVDLDYLIDTILSESPELQSPRAEITVMKPLGTVLGNEMLLTQSLSNLLGNAVKFVENKTPRVVVRSERTDGNVRLSIEDNGIGIEPQFHQKIFGIFERLDQRFEGTGVGLAIVRRAIERLGGKAGVESETGKGSCFWFELPGANARRSAER